MGERGERGREEDRGTPKGKVIAFVKWSQVRSKAKPKADCEDYWAKGVTSQ